jgi:hypothetical protein
VLSSDLPDGIYERLLTRELQTRLAGLRSDVSPVDDAETAQALGEFVGRQITAALLRTSSEDRVAKANSFLSLLEADLLEPGPQHLMAVAREEQPGVWKLLQSRPAVPLCRPALLTNAPSDPKLGSELRAELTTADRVDLLCAFVKWYGLRVLEAELKELKARGIPMRVLTTTYMGATDRKALD